MLNPESESSRKHGLEPKLKTNSPGFLTQVNESFGFDYKFSEFPKTYYYKVIYSFVISQDESRPGRSLSTVVMLKM